MVETRETFVLRRVYAVPPEKVWRAWIEADALRNWLGQDDSPGWRAELDVRVGGRYRFVLRESGGRYYEAHGVYREIVPGRKLVFTWSWRNGAVGGEATITVLFEPVAGGTAQLFTLDPVSDPRERNAWRADFKRMQLLLEEK